MSEKKKVRESAAPSGSDTAAGNNALATIPINEFVSTISNAAEFLGTGFEDLSLPPIIKSKGLKQGDIIFGEIDSFQEYSDGKNIQSAFCTIHVLKPNPATKSLDRLGMRASLPVGAVLQRALGGLTDPKATPKEIIAAIQTNGYGKGTVLAMRYNGTGKERKNQNAPHLWDIKAKKPTGETVAMGVDHANKKK